MKAAQTGMMAVGWRDVDQAKTESVDRILRPWEGWMRGEGKGAEGSPHQSQAAGQRVV